MGNSKAHGVGISHPFFNGLRKINLIVLQIYNERRRLKMEVKVQEIMALIQVYKHYFFHKQAKVQHQCNNVKEITTNEGETLSPNEKTQRISYNPYATLYIETRSQDRLSTNIMQENNPCIIRNKDNDCLTQVISEEEIFDAINHF